MIITIITLSFTSSSFLSLSSILFFSSAPFLSSSLPSLCYLSPSSSVLSLPYSLPLLLFSDLLLRLHLPLLMSFSFFSFAPSLLLFFSSSVFSSYSTLFLYSPPVLDFEHMWKVNMHPLQSNNLCYEEESTEASTNEKTLSAT